ncbi:MAG: sigma-70 family RNA polymerase sigma factor [Prolixibacteraceae bacterium]|nr:sigma-70 family RNA polymerase sigma factor [Prolixibacteraceae bacterium]
MVEKADHSEKALIDQEKVKEALQGNEKAFSFLFLKYRDAIYYMLLKMVKNKNDAEDLTFEAFGKAFSNLHMYSSDYAFSTWLYRIATNNCIDFMRKQKGIHYSIDQSLEQEPDMNGLKLRSNVPNPEEDLIIKQREKLLHAFVEELKPGYRSLIVLHYFKEYSYEEIAKTLDLPLGTVKVKLFRARKMLFDLIGNAGLSDE